MDTLMWPGESGGFGDTKGDDACRSSTRNRTTSFSVSADGGALW